MKNPFVTEIVGRPETIAKMSLERCRKCKPEKGTYCSKHAKNGAWK
jgi:hypothetical protein